MADKQLQAGCLYPVPTPIGNFDDMTFRAIDVIKRADIVLSEDTRNTALLFAHFDIHTPLLSYHQHNEQSRIDAVLERLGRGESVALVSDAGMPCISDPGAVLVRAVIEAGYTVSPLPGANAGLVALVGSALSTDHFYFHGFLPAKGRERRADLEAVMAQPVTTILYEAPHRLRETLADLAAAGADRRIVLARELTKTYEEFLYFDLTEAIAYYREHDPRGEYVLVLEGAVAYQERTGAADSNAMTEAEIIHEIEALLRANVRVKDIARQLALKTERSKNELYDLVLQVKQGRA